MQFYQVHGIQQDIVVELSKLLFSHKLRDEMGNIIHVNIIVKSGHIPLLIYSVGLSTAREATSCAATR
jgi:hypothetical protein